VDTWGPRHTGPSRNAHGGFSINTPTAKHLRSRVKELWAQIFLKKRVMNQQITEEFTAGILAESKDPESVDWVAFAADKMRKPAGTYPARGKNPRWRASQTMRKKN
jgi:hypothetical protein